MPILHFDSENVRTETGGANGLQSTFEKRSSPSRKVDEVQLVRKRDVFSLPLLEATRHATRLTQCVITATKEGTSAPFYTIIMSEVLVASISASAAGDTAEEKITLKFLKIEIKRASEGSDRTLSAPPH
jgi:type VI protein secretion system component Hcp